ncbi:MAG TPA: YggS family pyridoxal phosphate-dependent enzyme [Candidatus Ornithospirochaeta avicola]|uniref:Pyridoxal phosphate homeostasis protein n=1 Tax=Candidatus Ornithospirochaeta avicola TaxID=2840896 RepID=A0A9D1PS36_9SPIO|nr:YggS family pyridoxal phosphate-dependent enzyme [Candidatus Ornithospirochaeta avicola]
MNYRNLRDEIDKNVFILPVSKTKPYSAILDVFEEGARAFGENRVQEIERKFPLPENRPEGMKVYLIGQLQKNKVRKAVFLSDRIESVDSKDLLLLIDRECGRIGKKIEVLLEFNSSKEENKSGFEKREDLLDALKLSLTLKNLDVIGIMTVGPLTDDEGKIRSAFKETHDLFKDACKLKSLSILSMGMSADYKIAIEEKSTEVRLGSIIFGERK